MNNDKPDFGWIKFSIYTVIFLVGVFGLAALGNLTPWWLNQAVEDAPAYALGAVFIVGVPLGIAFTIIGWIQSRFSKRS